MLLTTLNGMHKRHEKIEIQTLIIMKKYLIKKLKTLHQLFVSKACLSKEQVKPDEYKVIMAGNIMVAQGYECSRCKVIRSYNQPTCNCH